MKDYNSMSTPDLEDALSEIESEIVLNECDEEYVEQLEAEYEEVQDILAERALMEDEVSAEIEAGEE